MEGTKVNHLNFNYKEIVLNEIALEGLEGIGLKLLWDRLKYRLSYEITDKLKKSLWSFIVACNSVEVFNRPEPAIYYEILNRFEYINEESGYLLERDIYFDGPYDVCLSSTSMGSCMNEKSRVIIPKTTLSGMSYEEVVEDFGDTLVIVASLEARWRALAPNVSKCTLDLLKPLNYAILEVIGRARENGQMTVGKTNLLKLSNDPKMLFYHRKKLEELKLIHALHIMQTDGTKSFKSLILRLNRFNTPRALILPSRGKLSNLRDHLLKQPGNRDNRLNLLNHNLIPKPIWKMIGRKISTFKFEGTAAAKKNSVKLLSDSDESASSDEEGPPLKCKQKIAVNIYEQAYGAIMESGLNGLTQVELGQLLGVGFYASRTIIRYFTNLNLIRIYTIDHGKQKTCKYVLRSTSGDSLQAYAVEKQKLVDYFKSMENAEVVDEPMEIDENSGKRKSFDGEKNDTNKKNKPGLQDKEDPNQSNDQDDTNKKVKLGLQDKEGPNQSNNQDDTNKIIKLGLQDKEDPNQDDTNKIIKLGLQDKEDPNQLNNQDDTNKIIKLELQDKEDPDQSNQIVTPQDLSNIIPIKLYMRGPTISINKSLKDPSKCLSMRALKIVNGIIKVTREHEVIESCATLNHLVSKLVQPPAIEPDTLKRYISKLGEDDAIKVYKIQWPNFKDKRTILLCAPDVKKDHPKILEIYKRICTTATKKHKEVQDRKKLSDKNKLFNQAYSRFLKIQKLHEFVYNLVYVNPDKVQLNEQLLPDGFVSIKTILLEMALELAIGHLSVRKLYDLEGIDVAEIEPKMKIKDSPPHMSQTILYSTSFVLAFKNSIEVLASIGLLQVCFQIDMILNCLEDKSRQIVYVNRRPKLIDTRGEWPPPDTKPKDVQECFYFCFENLDDVKKYWSQVFVISVGTKVTAKNRKKISKTEIPVRDFNEVQKCDNGELLGDGLGPAGFHSTYHTDIIQLWQPFKVLTWKMTAAKQKPKPPPIAREVGKKRRRVVKKPGNPKAKKNVPKKEKPSVPIPRRRERKPKPEPKCVWSKKQDEILLWCKVAIKIMSPLQISGSMQVANIVSKDLLNITDSTKTVALCYKRMKVLEQTPAFILRQQHLVNQLRSHRAIITKYEGLMKKLRSKHIVNLNKYINEARIRCMELVSIVKQLAVGNIMRQQVPAVALDYQEFHDKFFITYQGSKCLSLYSTPEECSTDVSTVKEGIIVVLCIGYLTNLSSSMSTKVYNTFNQYPERTLRIATEQLHKSGAVSIRDKFINLQFQKASYSDIIQYASGYKISSTYQRRWMHRLNDTFLDNALNLLESCQETNNIKPSSEMSCFLNELQAQGAISIQTIQSPNLPSEETSLSTVTESFPLTELEMRNKFKSGTVGWINKSNVKFMKDLYRNIDYGAAIRDLIINASVKISEVLNMEDDLVLTTLEEAGEKGRTFKELQSLTNYEPKYLQKILMKHEEDLIVKRVGFYENYIILSKYVKVWCINTGDDNFIPSPWFHLGLQIMYPIFVNWASTILNKIFENPGSTIATISETLTYITPRSVQEICMFFQNCECVVLKTLVIKSASLFADDDCDVVEYALFNQYASPELIVVFPVKDTILKFVSIRKNIVPYCLSL